MVCGAIANKYLNGGAAWTRLSWLLGFKKLGFKTIFVEHIDKQTCVNSSGDITTFENSVNLEYFKRIIDNFGISDCATLIYEKGERTFGLTYTELLDLAPSVDLLINISGHLSIEAVTQRLKRKIYIDLDPGFTQFWYAAGNYGARLTNHDFYFTIGENIGTPHSSIPVKDIHWHHIRQPILLDYWPVVKSNGDYRFTTIATWRGPYGPVQYEDKTFGLKVHEFRKFAEIPSKVPYPFEIALNIHADDKKDLYWLHECGWKIINPEEVTPDPNTFRQYIQGSSAEFSVAQGVYVETCSGWVSDRTIRYLASGKPTLVQDTGFSRNYPVGEGLIAFRNLEEAINGAERIMAEYDTHSHKARLIAEEYFDSDKVLTKLVEEVGL
jgi:hypothetical protein